MLRNRPSTATTHTEAHLRRRASVRHRQRDTHIARASQPYCPRADGSTHAHIAPAAAAITTKLGCSFCPPLDNRAPHGASRDDCARVINTPGRRHSSVSTSRRCAAVLHRIPCPWRPRAGTYESMGGLCSKPADEDAPKVTATAEANGCAAQALSWRKDAEATCARGHLRARTHLSAR